MPKFCCNFLPRSEHARKTSSFAEGAEGSYLPNCKTNLVIDFKCCIYSFFVISQTQLHTTWAVTSLHILLAVALPDLTIDFDDFLKICFVVIDLEAAQAEAELVNFHQAFL